jgi:hypothetical protein
MTEHYDDRLDIGWPDKNVGAPTEELVQISCGLTLRHLEPHRDVALLSNLTSLGFSQKIKLLFRKILPTRQSMSIRYPVPQDSFRIFFCYPLNWLRLIRERFPSLVRSHQNQRSQLEVDAISQLNLWLQPPRNR